MAVDEAISFWSEIQRFEDMLVADPRSLSFAPLSELYRKLGLLDDAVSVAKKGCDLHPEYAGGFFALGSACLDKGLQDEARHALEHVIHLSPENLRAQKMLGQLYVEAGELESARRALEKVLEQNPDDTESALLLSSLSSSVEEAGDEEEILEDLEVLEELEVIDEEETEEPELSGFAAEVRPAPAAQSSVFATVAEPAQDAARHPSRDPLTTATLAELYVSQGFVDKAIGIYQELLAADPGNPPYRLRLAELKTALERQSAEGAGPAPEPLYAEEQEQEEAFGFEDPFEVGEAPREETAAACTAIEEPVTAPAAIPAGQVPQPVEAPAALKMEAVGAGVGTAPAGVEAELSRWLENIRRRRDGL